jgi:hypothetical protein
MLSQLTLRDKRMGDLQSLFSGGKSQTGFGQLPNAWPHGLPLVGFNTPPFVFTARRTLGLFRYSLSEENQ